MECHWIEQSLTDVSCDNDWLSAREMGVLSGLRIPKRRADWRLGRWTAKQALALWWDLPVHPRILSRLEVHAAASGAPKASCNGSPAPVSISISHRAGVAACCVVPLGTQLGCDLELVEARDESFIYDYFSSEEQHLIHCAPVEDRPRVLALLWSAKESALKAMEVGLRLDTKRLTVSLDNSARVLSEWNRLQVRHEQRTFDGWWQSSAGWVRTVVTDRCTDPPICIRNPAMYTAQISRSSLSCFGTHA